MFYAIVLGFQIKTFDVLVASKYSFIDLLIILKTLKNILLAQKNFQSSVEILNEYYHFQNTEL